MEELNFIELVNMFLRKWWLIAIFAIVCGTATYLYSDICIEQSFQTDGSFYVNIDNNRDDTSEKISNTNLITSTRLAVTYTELLKSRTFCDDVSAMLLAEKGKQYDSGKIKNMLSVTSVNETEIISLTITGNDPQDVYDILTCVMALAPSKITSTVGGGSVTMVDEPFVPSYPTGPNKTRNTVIGILVGIVLSLLLIFFMDLFDTHIKSSEEVRAKYKLPVLGEIPQYNGDR